MLGRGIVVLVPDFLCSAFMLSLNRVIAKDVKSCTYYCYVRCATLIVRVEGNAFAPNRRNSLPFTVRTSRQRCAIKRFVVCYVVWLRYIIFGWVFGQAQGALSGQDGNRAQVLQHNTNSYKYISHISQCTERANSFIIINRNLCPSTYIHIL